MDNKSLMSRSVISGIGLARRQVLRGLAGIAAAAVYGRGSSTAGASQAGSRVSLPCVPCFCEGDTCACCIVGLTGGGIVQLQAGEAQIVVFATRLEEGVSQQGAGFVRWIDTNWNGEQLMLESVGPIVYERVPDQDQARDILGIMRANGAGGYPFRLRVTDYGPTMIGQDLASISVGKGVGRTVPAAPFHYEQDGRLVGGDFQLLDSVAPVQSG